MSVLNGLLLAPTVEYRNYTQLMWIGILISVVAALAVFFVFFFISRRVRRSELEEDKRAARQSETTESLSPEVAADTENVGSAADAEPCAQSDAAEDEAYDEAPEPVRAEEQDVCEESDGQDAAACEPILTGEEVAETETAETTRETEAVCPTEADEAAFDAVVEEAATESENSAEEARSAESLDAVAAADAAQNEPDKGEELPLPEFVGSILAELSEEDARAFEYYIINCSEPVKTKVRHPMGLYEKEKDFLKDFFVSYAKYKKLLSADAYEKLYARYSRTVRDDRVRTKLNNKLINVLYFYRKADEENLAKCKALCKKDVELNFDKIDVRDCRLPALKRLILIEASEKNFDEALHWCDLAISRNIFDKKDEGFEARREKLEEKLEKQRRREEKQRKIFKDETLK